MRKLPLSALVLFWLIFSASGALSFYCGNYLVSEGDTMAEVLLKCGEPFFKDQHVEKEREDDRTVYVVVDEWIYNFGPQDWLYSLTFRNGTLKKIRTLGYGYQKD